MSYQVDMTFRGLALDASVEDYDPGVHTFSNGDPGYPPSGGNCEDFSWEIEDIDEVLLELELSTEGLDNMVRAFYRMFGRLPETLVKKIDEEWAEDIMDAVDDYFWNTMGGPGGQEDWHYDG